MKRREGSGDEDASVSLLYRRGRSVQQIRRRNCRVCQGMDMWLQEMGLKSYVHSNKSVSDSALALSTRENLRGVFDSTTACMA